MEKLNLFFSKIKELSLWQRVFSWKIIKILSYEAYQEFKEFERNFNSEKDNLDQLNIKITELKSKNENNSTRIQEFEKDNLKKENKIDSLEKKINDLNDEIKKINYFLTKYKSTDEERTGTYHNNIAQLNQVKENLENERKRLNDDRVKEKEEEFEKMKKTWSNHEIGVEQSIKTICQKHTINYIDKVPFNGNPDNTIEICGEYIVFDAKSPFNNELRSFPNYIIEQTKNIKKYAKQENVKKDIFLVIPSNTIDVIPVFTYNMSDYNVYIVTKDSLEPIILSLKKIEEYEFADQLSPEERDNICRLIGKFSHTTKRRILVDQFFAEQYLELLRKCKTDLPNEILRQVSDIEKAEVINPPLDKRLKQLITKDLEEKYNLLEIELGVKKIEIPED